MLTTQALWTLQQVLHLNIIMNWGPYTPFFLTTEHIKYYDEIDTNMIIKR